MLRNYLKIALRNLGRNRGFTFINVSGLAIGMASCLLIFLYVRDELSYDRYHERAGRIVRLAANVEGASFPNGIAKVPDLWGPGAKMELPEVIDETRFVLYGRPLVELNGRAQFEPNGLYADSSTFLMFTWPLIQGDAESALAGPDKIVITESFAARWFGGQDPMGQTLIFDNEDELTVSAVVKDVPPNSHFTFDFLVSLESYREQNRGDWLAWSQFYTYLLLDASADRQIVSEKFDAVLDRHLDPETAAAYAPVLQPITEIHLHSNMHREIDTNSAAGDVYILSTIALLILLIAGTNFVTLSTARSSRRAQEVGIRKVSGADRPTLIGQFLGESILLCGAALATAWVISISLLAQFNIVAGKAFSISDLLDWPLLAVLLAGALVIGVTAGVYPAFVLSSFRPVKVLKGDTGQIGGGALRKGLVVLQFAVSAALIIATAVVYDQLSYIRDKDLGFDKERILVISTNERSTASRYETIKDQLRGVPGVVDASFSANRPGGSDWGIPVEFEGIEDDRQPAFRMLCVDEDFIDTFGMELVDGRGFSLDFPSDTTAYVINETGAAALGWTVSESGRIGMPKIGREYGGLIGIVKDFHFRSMHEPIGPILFFVQRSWLNTFNVKIEANAAEETIAAIREIMASNEPKYPFVYRFFDDQFDSLHAAEARVGVVLAGFAALAVLIACLGLFGLASYSAERRTKEIGIRKGLGASASRIVVLFSADTTALVAIGVALASPVAYYVMNEWLSSFAYSVDVGWKVFAYAASSALGLAVCATLYQVLRASWADPITSLRHE